MTIVIGFYCNDGVVIASDSMITPSLDGIGVGHHKGKKVYNLCGQQIFSFCGDPGLAARFRAIAESKNICYEKSPLQHCIELSQDVFDQFQTTGMKLSDIDLGLILAFPSKDGIQCCVFENRVQPRLLDQDYHYIALGVGKMSADPFLRFLDDIFIKEWASLTVKEAQFLTVWTLDHVIETNPGGIAGPIQMALLSNEGDGIVLKEFTENEILERRQAIKSAEDALRAWRDGLSGSAADSNMAPPTLN